MWKQAETEFLKVVLKICADSNAITGLKISDLEPKFWRQSYEDLLVKTQSFSTLRASGVPAIQAFTYSHLSRDPESDAMVFDAYQEELAQEMDAVAGLSTGGGGSVGGTSGSVQTYGGDEDDTPSSTLNAEGGLRHGNISGSGHPRSSTGVCPVCGRTFKKRTNNQIYDRPECRAKGHDN